MATDVPHIAIYSNIFKNAQIWRKIELDWTIFPRVIAKIRIFVFSPRFLPSKNGQKQKMPANPQISR